MGRSIFLLIVLLAVLFSSGIAPKMHLFDGSAADSVQIDIDTLYDASEIPNGYKAYINTPICEANKCYAVEIIFYWDLIGRFLKYDTIAGAALTKLDHIPFQQQDYVKLQDILRNEHSILTSYGKDELVLEQRISEIDGFTGATVAEIKENVIEGAVYSSYTLWHIAHGQTSEKLKEITQCMFDKNLVQKLVSLEDQMVNYYLIDTFTDEDFMNYIPEVLLTIKASEGYFAKNAIEKMPATFFAKDTIQSFFASNFNHLNYFAQVVLLEQLTDQNLIPAMSDTLKNQIEGRDSHKNELIRQLVSGKSK